MYTISVCVCTSVCFPLALRILDTDLGLPRPFPTFPWRGSMSQDSPRGGHAAKGNRWTAAGSKLKTDLQQPVPNPPNPPTHTVCSCSAAVTSTGPSRRSANCTQENENLVSSCIDQSLDRI